jgi:hypothetical protein
VFTLGATLYFLTTGRPPFTGWLPNGPIVPPHELAPGLPPAFSAVCLRCLEADPDRRFPDMRALGAALAPFVSGASLPPTTIVYQPPGARGWGWRRGAAALLVGSLALVGASGHVPSGARAPEEAAAVPDQGPDWSVVRGKARELRRAYLGDILAQRTNRGWLPSNLSHDAEHVEVYAHVQALYACLTCPELSPEERSRCVASLFLPFRAGGEVARLHTLGKGPARRTVGWGSRQKSAYTMAEPLAWAASALAVAYRGEPPGARRDALAGAHRRTVAMLRHYRTAGVPGAWNMYVDQKGPGRFSVYSTAMVLQALLEARAAGLPWLVDGKDERDRLLGEIVRFLLSQFRNGPGEVGWRGRLDGQPCEADDGLSLNVYHLLLRAEREGATHADLSAVAAAAAAHVNRCCARSAGHPDHRCELSTPLYRVREWTASTTLLPEEKTTFLWHPHAVLTAVELAHREGRAEGMRQALGHLVVGLGDSRLSQSRGQKWVFQFAEELMSLSAVEGARAR